MKIEQLKREVRQDVVPCADELSLKMIAVAARLSSPYVSHSRCEVWKLYARLLWWLEQSDVERKYLADIESVRKDVGEGPVR